jgi:phenylacetate-CoA ligase
VQSGERRDSSRGTWRRSWRGRLYSLLLARYRFLDRESCYRELASSTEDPAARFLVALCRHARARVPYYAQLPESAAQGSGWTRVPLLTKDLVRAHFEGLKSTDLESRRWHLNSSGGSLGHPVTLVQDTDFRRWSYATDLYYYREFLGADLDSVSKVVLWGSERDLFGESPGPSTRFAWWLTQTTLLNTFKVAESDFVAYVDRINARRPYFVRGYAGSLYQLARIVRRRNLRLHRPRFVVSSAEVLRPPMRAEIEEAFGARVYDFYGSREVGAMAGECQRGKLHVFTFNNLLEVLAEDGRPAPPGEEGRVVVTNLHNYSMPMIRYEIGDTALRAEGCTCGSRLPALVRIAGRITDHFPTARGDIVHGEYFTHLFYFRDWVAEFQVLQRELNRIEVYWVPLAEIPASEKEDIEAKIRLVMGEECAIDWRRVDEVPRTPEGKLLFTRSLVGG